MEGIYGANYSSSATPENGNICAMENVATAMTVAVRNSQWGNSSMQMAPGQVYVPVTHMHVTWYWMVLPVLIWVLALVMLIGTVVMTRRAGLWAWGLSPLALIFLGFDGTVQAHLESERGFRLSQKSLEKKAGALQVRLRLDGRHAVMTH